MKTIHIDPDPRNVVDMITRGFLHSHGDGRWRYSPFGGETVYCNDPTERFPKRASFAKGWAAAADPDSGLYAAIYGDGTRGLNNWRGTYGNGQTFARMCLLYGPRHEGERQQREWIQTQFKEGA